MNDLKLILEQRERCKAILTEHHPVVLKFEDKTELAREIYTFRLEDHPTAKKAFIWQKEITVGTNEPEFIIALAIAPINSPEDALGHFRAQFIKTI